MTLEEIIINKVKYVFQTNNLYVQLNRVDLKAEEVDVRLFDGSSSSCLSKIEENDYRDIFSYKSIELRFTFTGDNKDKPYYKLTKEQYESEMKRLEEFSEKPFWQRMTKSKEL